MKRFLILVCATCLLVCVCGCGGSSSSKGSKTEKIITTTAKSNTSSSSEGEVGQPVKAGDLTVTVLSWQMQDELDTLKPEKVGDRYVVADCEVSNNGTAPVESSYGDFSIRTPEGYQYRAFDYSGYSPRYPDATIDPQGKSRGGVTIEVPGSTTSMVLEFSNDQSRAKIKLQ